MIKTIKPQEFSMIIENLVLHTKMSYLDAVSHYCEENKMEPETVGKLVQGSLKQKIREEAIDLHFLPKTTKIPGL